MSAAPERPVLAADGAPVSVLLDFDGTISLEDVGDVLLGRLVEDQAQVHEMDRRYLEQGLGSRELIAWDMEVLYLARREGIAIAEVPVLWLNSPDSRVSFVRDAIVTLRDLLRIRWIHRNDPLRRPD